MFSIDTIFSEEENWILMALTTYGESYIQRLAYRLTEVEAEADFSAVDRLGVLARLTIQAMRVRIREMSVEENGARGGEYAAFLHELHHEISRYHSEASTKFSEPLGYLSALIEDISLDLTASKEEVVGIYTRFARKAAYYASAEYEGHELAKALSISLSIQTHGEQGLLSQVNCGCPEAPDVPKVTLFRFYNPQSDRSNHFNLHAIQVDDVEEEIPHSILGTGNCLFDAIAQALIEIKLIKDPLNVPGNRIQRRRAQTQFGIDTQNIPEGTPLPTLPLLAKEEVSHPTINQR